MKSARGLSAAKKLLFTLWLAGGLAFSSSLRAQQIPARILSDIDESSRTALPGTRPPAARPENESGRVPGEKKLEGVALDFSRSPEQQAALDTLIAAQQDPYSPSYHQWLTPDEFGARFGGADADLARVQTWLELHGFTVDGITRGRNRITFSGTVAQIESAFGTELHYYTSGGETHFAPSQDLSVPSALASVVQAVMNLSSFRPHPHIRNPGPRAAPNPDFTSSQSGNHFMSPADVATIYDLTPAYQSGYNGAGQSIAVLGQSAIVLTDIEHFQLAAGFAKKDPTIVLVPGTGASTIVPGDEAESDLDLEYTSTIASGATIYFVYTGNTSASGVFDSLTYAVNQKTAPVISMSYGTCETALTSSSFSSLNSTLQQAASQGQTVIVSAGDSGSTGCYGQSGFTTAQQEAVAADFPASSQYVTAIGGTEFPSADVVSSNTTYWKSSTGTDVIGSALSYIPEQVWNDDIVVSNTANMSSGGGGVSAFAPRPSWQTGVPGIPSGSFRLLPDISLDSSDANAPYLYCSSDSSIGVTGSCSNGFRDTSNTNLTVAGGTSFAAPIFAGMVAILNDRLNNTAGQGVINSTLYTLAANATTYSKAFHDITAGNNECNLGTNYCSTASNTEYAAGVGYDEASGLGSIDFNNLMAAWPGVSSAPNASKTAESAATSTPFSGANDTITITVSSASSSSSTTPTGSLAIAVDGTTVNPSLALVSGSASYNFASTIIGAHTIAASYSGDSTYAPSNNSLTVNVAARPVANPQSVTTVANAAKSFTLSGTPGVSGDALTYTIASNPSHGALSGAAPNVTYTPVNGYTGADSFTFTVTEKGTVSSPATVSITVGASAPPPVAKNQSVSTNKNTALSITLSGTPGTSGDSLTYAIAGNPAHGTLSGTPPNVTYTPASGYTGSDSFTFNANESNGAQSAMPGTITISVLPTALVASNTAETAATSTPLTGANDTISFTVSSGSSSSTVTPTGTLAIAVDGSTVNPALALVNGSASYIFASTVTGSHTIAGMYSGDSTYTTSNNSITVNVIARPAANPQSVTTVGNTAKPITLSGTPGVAGDPLTYTIASNPFHGTLSGTPPNVIYTPTNGFVGQDGFTFTVTENGTVSSPASVSITVTTPPPPPVANSQSVSTATNTPVAITLSGTAGTPGDALTFVIVGNPGHGALSGTPPNLTYTPASNYTGIDSFTFNANESNGTQSAHPATVTITIGGSGLASSQTTVSAASSTPASGANDGITVRVAPASGSGATPTGTVTILVDGAAQAPTLTLSSGSAAYNFSSTVAGSHTIAANYSGDTAYSSSSGSTTVTISGAAPAASKTTLSAATLTPASGANDAVSITVAPASGSGATPTGTLTILVDGATQSPALTLAGGAATYTFSSSVAGTHAVAANYSGDSNYLSSSGNVAVTVGAKGFQLSGTSATVAQGNSGTTLMTVTPLNGYTGTIAWTVTSSPALTNGCFSLPSLTVSGSSAVTATLTVYTVSTSCPAPAKVAAGGRSAISSLFYAPGSGNTPPFGPSSGPVQATLAGMALTGMAFFLTLGKSSRRLKMLAAIGALAVAGLGMAGCAGTGSSSTTPTASNVARGAYTFTVAGTDTVTSTMTASATLTVTVD